MDCSLLVSKAAFVCGDTGSNLGWFAAVIQIKNWVSQIIQAMIGLITYCNPMWQGGVL